MVKFGKLIAVASLGCTAMAGTANAACWSPTEVEAAILRDLQSRLMVASLRCANSSHDVLTHYNDFVKSKRALLASGNTTLKAYFAKHYSGNGRAAYDSYATSLANRYGAGSGDLSECQEMKYLAHSAASSDPDHAALVQIARENGLKPALPGGQCTFVIAARSDG